MSLWQEKWPEIETAVRLSETRGECVSRVSAVLGYKVSWDATQRAYKRYTGQSILQFLGGDQKVEADSEPELTSLYMSPTELRVPPWLKTPRVYNQSKELRILVVPDTQVMPGVELSHFTALGRYAAAKRPDIIIHLGDFRDFPSLSSYESAVKKTHQGRCKLADIESGNRALEMLETQLAKAQGYSPRKIMLRGNHDCEGPYGRIGRYLAEHPDDRRLIESAEFLEHKTGWEVIPFLEPVEVQGTLYVHLVPYTAKGKVTKSSLSMGAGSAAAQIKITMQSCTTGHTPGLDYGMLFPGTRRIRGIQAGSFYQHTDDYAPGSNFWRGAIMKSRCRDGYYSAAELDMEFLLEKYG